MRMDDNARDIWPVATLLYWTERETVIWNTNPRQKHTSVSSAIMSWFFNTFALQTFIFIRGDLQSGNEAKENKFKRQSSQSTQTQKIINSGFLNIVYSPELHVESYISFGVTQHLQVFYCIIGFKQATCRLHISLTKTTIVSFWLM